MNILYWLRSDLRLHDNPALNWFASSASRGLILWCPSRSQRRAKRFRSSFLWGTALSVAEDLTAIGGQVILDARDIRDVLPDLLRCQTIDCIVFSQEPGTEEKSDEAWVRSLGIRCEAFASGTLVRQDDLPYAVDAIPEVFTVFRKKLEDDLIIHSPLAEPLRLPAPLGSSAGLGLSHQSVSERIGDRHPRIEPGEKAGLARLQDYVWAQDRLKVYKETRDGLLNWEDSSKLSPWLAIGALSPRTIYAAILRYEREQVKNQSTYWLFFELLWRDYFHWIGLKWGSRLFTGMKLPHSPTGQLAGLVEWKEGRTGQPFIDAHMRELNATGWMSNRGRQNVANYLVKAMGVDWRLGAAFFEEQLIDYDPCSNWGNWAYQAGVGQDPRNRRFDPAYQAGVYDADGAYQARWNR